MRKIIHKMILARLFIGAVLILALHGCAVRGPVVPAPVAGVPLSEICTKYNVSWQWDGVTQVVMMEYKGNKAKALVGSKTVLVGKEKIMLNLPLVRLNSVIYVPDDFETKVFAPFGIAPSPEISSEYLRYKTIIIDPGHGGKDPGTRGQGGSVEKDIVLDVSKKIKAILERAGIKVIMSRDSDEFISLEERSKMASKNNVDIFVSIHANFSRNKKVEGMEVYYVKTDKKSDLDEETRRINERVFVQQLNLKPSVADKIVADMMYAFKVSASGTIARRIAAGAQNDLNIINRGARECRFSVVRNSVVPAVLVEIGYVSNRSEEKRLKDPLYRTKIAETIAKSIIKYASDS